MSAPTPMIPKIAQYDTDLTIVTHAHSQVIKVLNKVLKVVQQSSLFVLIASVRILQKQKKVFIYTAQCKYGTIL